MPAATACVHRAISKHVPQPVSGSLQEEHVALVIGVVTARPSLRICRALHNLAGGQVDAAATRTVWGLGGAAFVVAPICIHTWANEAMNRMIS